MAQLCVTLVGSRGKHTRRLTTATAYRQNVLAPLNRLLGLTPFPSSNNLTASRLRDIEDIRETWCRPSNITYNQLSSACTCSTLIWPEYPIFNYMRPSALIH